MTTVAKATTLDLFPLLGEAVQAIDPHYRPAMQQALEEAQLIGRDWALAFIVQGGEPRAMAPAELYAQMPFAAPTRIDADLAGAVERGVLWLDSGAYRLSERGRAGLVSSFAAVHAALVGYEPLPAADLGRLTDLLERVVRACLAAPEPAAKEALLASRRSEPGPQAALGARIDQYLTDLLRFRDDAHQAAWQPLGVGGLAWELLTLIWRGEANTREALQQQLERRGHATADYDQALSDLAGRGWLAEQDEQFRVTDAGRAVREQAEEQTDRLFYGTWNRLSAAEIDQLRELLTRLRDTAPTPAA